MAGVVWILIIAVTWVIGIANFGDLVSHGAYGFFVLPILATTVTILWYSRHAIGRRARDKTAKGQIAYVETWNERQYGETNKQSEKNRTDQLNALYQAAPLTPPERMRATIQFNTIKTPTYETRYFEGLSAEAQTGYQTLYSVDMLLELSEEERSIVLKNELHLIVLEDHPRYSKRDLDRMRYEASKQTESLGGRSMHDLVVKEISKQWEGTAAELKKDDRDLTHLGDYLVIPYSRTFDQSHEARTYADLLKTKILPQIKETIESYRDHKSVQTLEF